LAYLPNPDPRPPLSLLSQRPPDTPSPRYLDSPALSTRPTLSTLRPQPLPLRSNLQLCSPAGCTSSCTAAESAAQPAAQRRSEKKIQRKNRPLTQSSRQERHTHRGPRKIRKAATVCSRVRGCGELRQRRALLRVNLRREGSDRHSPKSGSPVADLFFHTAML